ncbi:MAG: DUF4160 domain-containing protein [Bauldia sp.]
MPTVLRFAGYRVVVYPADHAPSHVHVVGAGGEAVFNLNCPGGPVELRETYGIDRRQVVAIRRVLDDKVPVLCAEWRKIHGRA